MLLLVQSQSSGAGDVVMLLIILSMYFIPTIVAVSRKHHNALAIGALNLFLGWTILGWIGALVWALTAVQRREVD